MLAASKLLSALLRKTFSVGSRVKALNRVELLVKMEKKGKKKDLLKYKQHKTLRLSVNPVFELLKIIKKID